MYFLSLFYYYYLFKEETLKITENIFKKKNEKFTFNINSNLFTKIVHKYNKDIN